MPVDPRTPVIVGVAQLSRRPDDVAAAPEPAEMMAEVLRMAEDDAKASRSLLERADAMRTVGQLSWRYVDPSAEVAKRLGITPRETAVTATGGNSPQWLVNLTARQIAAGQLDVCLVAGAEAMYTRREARKAGVELPWTPLVASPAETVLLGEEKAGVSDAEAAAGLLLPPTVYPLFENALRAAAGETIDEHQAKIAGLWSRFSEVAARNPHAWSPQAKTPEEIATPGPDNRMIAFPYTKWMNANIQVDQAAGFILCSYEAAQAAGVADDRMVFPWAGADGNDHWFFTSRENLHSSVAIRACGEAALRLAGVGIDDIAHVDLYSCFPSAVQIAAAALGLALDDPARPLTLTGGLTFAGGPGNNYVSHSIATLVDRLRANPGELGLVTGLGWYVTKHSIGVYGTTPPAGGFSTENVQAAVDATPTRPFVTGEDGPVRIEAYTVTYERDGHPARAIATCLFPDGSRTLATTDDHDAVHALTDAEGCGRTAIVERGRLLLRY